jgi:hypothetical protein
MPLAYPDSHPHDIDVVDHYLVDTSHHLVGLVIIRSL